MWFVFLKTKDYTFFWLDRTHPLKAQTTTTQSSLFIPPLGRLVRFKHISQIHLRRFTISQATGQRQRDATIQQTGGESQDGTRRKGYAWRRQTNVYQTAVRTAMGESFNSGHTLLDGKY